MKTIDYRSVLLGTFMLVLTGITGLSAAAAQLNRTVTLTSTRMSVEQVFDRISRQSGFDIFYDYDELNPGRMVTLPAGEMTAEELLDAILGSQYTYRTNGNSIVISPVESVQQEVSRAVRITGRVTDISGKPLAGVSVQIKLSRRGAATDVDGRYVLRFDPAERPNATPVVVFSMIGMNTREVDYTGQETINITLEEAVHEIDDIVVTGYGDVSRRNMTGSVVSRKMEDLDLPGMTTVDNLLEGRIPGLFFTQTSGQPGVTPRLRVRGTSTIVGNQQPLLVVDGIVQADPVNIDPNTINDPDFVNLLGNAFMGISPSDIERIDVLKDAAATALYGARAANGIIVLTTKKGQAGAPKVGYRFDSKVSMRPRYTDRGFNMMNSAQRVDLSRELIEKGIGYGAQGYTENWNWPGYEGAYLDYFKYGAIDFDEYVRLTNYYETLNTDWLDILTRDTFSQTHTLSVNGGSQVARYYVSLGYADTQGNIRGESDKRYNTSARLNSSHGRFNIQVGMQASVNDKKYVPTELNVMSYASTMNRAIGLYNEDGSLWYYPRTGSSGSLPYNIHNEMSNSSLDIDQNMISLNANLQYRISEKIRAQVLGSYQYSNTTQDEWYGENSFHSANLRGDGGQNSMMPFGGVLIGDHTNANSYTLRAQVDYSDYFGQSGKHFFNAMLVGEVESTKYTGDRQEHRGYFKDRGRTFPNFTGMNSTNYPAFTS